uniref:Ig-like domain-containing protein n=1 Tax=Oreochromis niloticus TaxID=8128 RepID=A0A669D596_ORENI
MCLHSRQKQIFLLTYLSRPFTKVALLPCRFSGFIPDQPTVMWTRSDLDPKTVHMRLEGGDDLTGQNQHYSGRTSIMVDALNTGDFSLTLRKPQRTNVCNYTCTMSDGTGERRLTDVQLQVKGQQQTPDENTGEKISLYIYVFKLCTINFLCKSDG